MSFLNKIIDKAKNHKNEDNQLSGIPENSAASSLGAIAGKKINDDHWLLYYIHSY